MSRWEWVVEERWHQPGLERRVQVQALRVCSSVVERQAAVRVGEFYGHQ